MAMFFQNFKAVVTIGFFSELFFNFLVFSEFQRSGHKADLMSPRNQRSLKHFPPHLFSFSSFSTQWAQSGPNVATAPALAKAPAGPRQT